MEMDMKEADLEILVCNWAKDHGWLCPKLQWIGQTGWPDRTFIRGGVVVWIEFKRYKGGLRSMKQEYWMDQIYNHGCRGIFCSRADQAIAFLSSYD